MAAEVLDLNNICTASPRASNPHSMRVWIGVSLGCPLCNKMVRRSEHAPYHFVIEKPILLSLRHLFIEELKCYRALVASYDRLISTYRLWTVTTYSPSVRVSGSLGPWSGLLSC